LRRFLALLVPVLALSLVFAACSSNDSDGDSPTPEATAATDDDPDDDGGNGGDDPDDDGGNGGNGGNGGDDPDGNGGNGGNGGSGVDDPDDDSGNGMDGGNGGDPDDDGGSSGGGGDGGPAGLNVLAQTAQNLTTTSYRIVYSLMVTEPGEMDVAGTFTIASDPPRSAFTIEGNLGGGETTLMVITDDEVAYFCGDLGDGAQCLQFPSGGSSPIPLPSFFDTDVILDGVISADGVTVTSLPGATYANIAAECYGIDSPDGTGVVCVGSADGQLLFLLIDGADGTDFQLEALEIGEPTDEDFVPLYPIISVGQ